MNKIKKNWFEWSVFGVSAALIVALVAYLVYESARIGDTPPQIHVQIGTPEQRAGHFAVPVEVMNKGDHTAEGVHIEVVLRAPGKQENGELEIPFLPRRGSREGWVTFETDPRTGTLAARVVGYQKP